MCEHFKPYLDNRMTWGGCVYLHPSWLTCKLPDGPYQNEECPWRGNPPDGELGPVRGLNNGGGQDT